MVNKIDQYMLLGFFLTVCSSALFLSGKIQERNNHVSPLKLYEHAAVAIPRVKISQPEAAVSSVGQGLPRRELEYVQQIDELENQIKRLQETLDELIMRVDMEGSIPMK